MTPLLWFLLITRGALPTLHGAQPSEAYLLVWCGIAVAVPWLLMWDARRIDRQIDNEAGQGGSSE